MTSSLPPLVLALLCVCPALAGADKLIFQEKSLFGNVLVVERSDGTRVLSFDGEYPQSAWNPAHPDQLIYEYVQVMAGAPVFVPKARRLLLVGLGGGTLPSFWHRHFPKLHIDTVEIDPAVVKAAYRYFDLPRSERLTVSVGDGREHVQKLTGRYDVVVLDAYGPSGVPKHLTTLEFLREVRARVAPGGVLIANLHANASDYEAMLRTWQEAFTNLDIITPRSQPKSRVLVTFPDKKPARRPILARLRTLTRRLRLPFDLAKLVTRGWAAAPKKNDKHRPLRDD